jgi:hypothetical protein
MAGRAAREKGRATKVGLSLLSGNVSPFCLFDLKALAALLFLAQGPMWSSADF